MEKLLSFAFNESNESLEIYVNKLGASKLVEEIETLINRNKFDHTHLMTPDWGGDELTSELMGTDGSDSLIHHVKIIYFDSDN